MGKSRKLCKKTPRKSYVVAGIDVQRLYEEMRGQIAVSRLDEIMEITDKLPKLNKKPVFVHNRKGVPVKIVGTKGQVREIGIEYYDGVYYFDGNRIGRKKQKMMQAFFDASTGKTEETIDQDAMVKVWQKFQRQGRY